MSFETEPAPITFTSYQQPALPAGEYQLTISQQLSKGNDELRKTGTSKKFFVAGERFRINPREIGGVFPPAFSLGEHATVFPYVMISRSTLPWERATSATDNTTPWLGLLVIYENEAGDVTSLQVKLGTVKDQLKITAPLEPGQADTDTVQVLSIKRELLEKILPTKNDLCFLTHVRESAATNMAVLIANRLPVKGGVSTVYLVSLENRYADGEQGVFDYNTAKDGVISLVQLHSWSFNSTEHFKISQNFLSKAGDLDAAVKQKLNKILGKEFFTESDFIKSLKEEAQLTTDELNANKEKLVNDFSYGDFSNILKHLDRTSCTLRLPDSKLPATDANLKYVQQGFYPLPHRLRQGAQTVSWYHGPLATAPAKELLTGPVTSADSLLHYYQDNGMFDVSYAAAWELGRLLALQNAHFSTELYKWKKQYVRSTEKALQMQATPHLPGANRDHSPAPLPDSITNWLQDLALLKGVPFNYLVPDEELLPTESIRFFRLHKGWLQALLDGALSIGRITSKEHAIDKKIIAEEGLLAGKDITGFILRSEVVAGWPGLDVEGADDTGNLVVLRNEALSANVKLCLFEGELKKLLLHVKPEMLHFGIDGDAVNGYSKKWRNEDGKEDENTTIPVPVNAGVLSVRGLLDSYVNKSKTVTSSAHLAMQLLEGVDCVRFQV